MTLDAIMNSLLLFTFASNGAGALQILVFSNLGYVLCHCFAMSGFVLLRKDRPAWGRPLKLARPWVAMAAILAAWDSLLLFVGALSPQLSYGTGYKTTIVGLIVLGVGLVLYIYRVLVEDKSKLQLRLWAPRTEDETPPPVAVATSH